MWTSRKNRCEPRYAGTEFTNRDCVCRSLSTQLCWAINMINKHNYLPITVCHVSLNHCGLVTPYGVRDLGHHCFMWWLVACPASSHYLNQFRLFFQSDPSDTNFKTENLSSKLKEFSFECRLQNVGSFCLDFKIFYSFAINGIQTNAIAIYLGFLIVLDDGNTVMRLSIRKRIL